MEIVRFTAVGIGLYAVSGAAPRRLERARGAWSGIRQALLRAVILPLARSMVGLQQRFGVAA